MSVLMALVIFIQIQQRVWIVRVLLSIILQDLTCLFHLIYAFQQLKSKICINKMKEASLYLLFLNRVNHYRHDHNEHHNIATFSYICHFGQMPYL